VKHERTIEAQTDPSRLVGSWYRVVEANGSTIAYTRHEKTVHNILDADALRMALDLYDRMPMSTNSRDFLAQAAAFLERERERGL
jgi:hypothetical protein